MIRQFDAISVREDSAAVLCENELGVKVENVLDPSLLLEAAEYERFCYQGKPQEKPYIAAYVLDINKEKTAYIDAVAAEKGVSVRLLTVSGTECSIEEWLSSIKNAEYVITDSYHGSLFSILFGKQFQTFVNKERGEDRFVTLFKRLGIKNRLLYSVPELSVFDGRLDYDQVRTKLDSLRKESMDYLLESISK